MKRAVLLAVSLTAPLPAPADLGINVYGRFYHFDRARARELGVDNEINPGMGLRYRVARSERWQWIFDAGGALTLLHSETCN